MKKRSNRILILALLFFLFILGISLVNAGCCLNQGANFCKPVSEQECCDGTCPEGFYEDSLSCTSDDSKCKEQGCCVDTCESNKEYSECGTNFVAWLSCDDASIEECQLGCCVQVGADGTFIGCDYGQDGGTGLKKDCVIGSSSDYADFYPGVTGAQCTSICSQGTTPIGNIYGTVKADGIAVTNALVLLGGGIYLDYYDYTTSVGYEFNDIPVGEYPITAYYFGYKPVTLIATIYQNEDTELNIELTEPTSKGYVRGLVKDAITGDFIENAYVSFTIIQASNGAYTDRHGEYYIEDVDEGQITFTATAIGYNSDTLTTTINAGELAILDDFELTPSGYTPPQDQTCEEQGNNCFAYTYQCTGTHITELDQTCDINKQKYPQAGCCTNIEEIPLCINGQNTDQKISQTNFAEKTTEICKCGNDYYDSLTNDGYCCNNIYSGTSCSQSSGWISGFVKDNTGKSLNGVLIEAIKDNLIIGYDTSSTEFFIPTPKEGFYEIYNLPEGNYTIKASMYGYYDVFVENVKIEANKATQKDITLTPIPQECLSTLPAAVLNLTNIKGTTNIKVTWLQNCKNEFNVKQFNLYRNNALIKAFGVNENYEYIDDGANINGLKWNTEYTYKIVTITETNQQNQATAKINTGNQFCEGITTQEFCLNELFQKEIPMRFRSGCNNKNQIYFIENCGDADSGRICRQLNDQSWCTSPDACKNLGIEYNLGFAPNILGMYYYDTYLYDSSELSCHYNITSSFKRYCYLDYYFRQGPYTTIDRCLDCKQDGTCFDYLSTESCETDNCDYGDCKWYGTYHYADFGKGFCYEENYRGTEHCNLCNGNNVIFENVFCSVQLCSKLGKCFSGGGSCQDCTDSSRCESYTDQISCTGNSTSYGFSIADGCGSSLSLGTSSDICNLGVCKWSSNKCFKDGNDDNIADCAYDNVVCQIDTIPPSTLISSKPLYINSNGQTTTFSTDGADTFYCVASGECCPDKHIINNILLLPNQDFALEDVEGNYNIYFFSLDNHNNTEAIKKETIYVDTKAPDYTVTTNVSNSTQNTSLSKLAITIAVQEDAFCTDKLTLGYNTLIDSKINQKINSTTSVTYPDLADGFYYYTITCKDNYENTAEKNIWILADRIKQIFIISPPNGGVVGSPVLLDVRTTSKKFCRYKGAEANWQNLPSELDPNSGNYKYIASFNLDSGDYNYIVECYENPNYSGEQDQANVAFTVDETPPTTTPKYETGTGIFSDMTNGTGLKNPTVKLECADNPTKNTGCKETKYCYGSSDCVPNIALPYNQTFKMISIDNTHLCFYSADNGNNIEQTRCLALTMDNTAPTIIIEVAGVAVTSNMNASSVNITSYEKRPNIKVITSEPADIVADSTKLLNGSNVSIYLNTISVTADKEFILQPNQDLGRGTYTFYVKVRDKIGGDANENTASLRFRVEPTPLNVTFIEPKNGVAVNYSFDLTLLIKGMTTCKYSFDRFLDYGNMVALTKTGDDIYSKPAFNITSGDTSSHTLYVACVNEFGSVERVSKTMRVDTAKPAINKITAIPNPIAEEPVETVLLVETNKETICKYSKNTDNYEVMESKFPDYDNNIFRTTHNTNLSFSTEKADYLYNIICEAQNGLRTDRSQETINVDLTLPLEIIDQTPDYFSQESIILEIYTNKKSQCFYGTTSSTITNQFSTDTTSAKTHKQSLSLSAGTYTYHIECLRGEEIATAQISFTIDKTPPTMIYVKEIGYGNETGKTYKTNALKGEWKAEDNESNVVGYNVLLYLDNEFSDDLLVYSESTSETQEEITGLQLNDTEKYYFKVSAKNLVELWSTNKTGPGITVDTSLAPSSCNNNRKDNNEAGKDCGGVCPKGCPDNSSCSENSDCESELCADDICKESTCDDTLKGPDETDIDCGGSCDEKCDTGDGCDDNDDCKSGSCDISQGTCVEAGKCKNNKLDPGETDVDCGGICTNQCSNGDNCESSSDCESDSCVDYVCAQSDKCNNNILDSGETDIDCGGVCSSCPTGKSCSTNDDCQTTSCENGLCADVNPDKDNDGLNNEWENRYNEGDLDPDNYDTDGDGTPDGDEDFDEDGLTNTQEAESGTDPHKKDTDGDGYSDKEEIDKGTNAVDPDDYPKSSFLFYLFLLIILILLGAGGYFGYKKFKEMQEEKIEIPPIEPEKENKQEIRQFQGQTKEEQKPRSQSGATMPQSLRSKLEGIREEKQKKRENIFDRFGFGEQFKQQEIKTEQPKPKTYTEESPRVGWVELETPKKEELKPKEKMSSIFDRLPKISISPTRGKLTKQDIFAALSKMVGVEVKESTVKEFEDVAERKKLSKDQLIGLINKLSKEKKLDEESLHKLLSSIVQEKQTEVKEEKKIKLPTIVKKEIEETRPLKPIVKKKEKDGVVRTYHKRKKSKK